MQNGRGHLTELCFEAHYKSALFLLAYTDSELVLRCLYENKSSFRRIRERFLLIYELRECQKAVNFQTEYYGIKRMKIVLNGRKVGNGEEACYDKNVAYFTRRGLTKRTILHELCQNLAYVNEWEMSERREETEANEYARKILKRA